MNVKALIWLMGNGRPRFPENKPVHRRLILLFFKQLMILFTQFLAVVFSPYRWAGQLLELYFIAIALDFITGTLYALKEHKWKSSVAREGIWKKVGSIMTIAASALTDHMLQLLIDHVPSSILPFNVAPFFCPLVLIWYIVTELGSILENVGKTNTPMPTLLKQVLHDITDTISSLKSSSSKKK